MAQDSARGWRSRLMLLAAAAIAMIAIVYAVTREDPTTAAAPVTPPATANAGADPEAVIRALQEQVGANPNDWAGWQRLGQAYYMTERYADAERAYRRASTLQPDNGSLWSAYGEAALMASERDPMPPVALNAFRKAHELDAKDPRAR